MRPRKKRGKPTQDAEAPPDASVLGTIPWTAEGLCRALDRQRVLRETPKDDWDHRDPAFVVTQEDGQTSDFRINTMTLDAQMAMWMHRRYHANWLNHLWRLRNVTLFLEVYVQPLLDQPDLAIPDPPRPSCPMIRALAVLPFSRELLLAAGPTYFFDFDAVMEKASQLAAEDEDEIRGL